MMPKHRPPHVRPPPATPRTGLARRPARSSLALLLSLVSAGLLPGVSRAWADQHVSVRILSSPESGPGAPSASARAVPGLRNELQFGMTCNVHPPTGWCDGGHVVANFGAKEGQRVVRAWTSHGQACVTNDWYLSCPIPPARHREMQVVTFALDVAPWSYATNDVIAAGADGLALPPTPFSIEMQGRGELRIGTPEDMVISETGSVAQLPFVNEGPSTNRGLTWRFGPFPAHLAPRLLDLDLPCALTPERVLQCGPVDQAPDTRGFLPLAVQAVHPLPQLPDIEFIRVVATSDLTPQVQTEFAILLVERPAAP